MCNGEFCVAKPSGFKWGSGELTNPIFELIKDCEIPDELEYDKEVKVIGKKEDDYMILGEAFGKEKAETPPPDKITLSRKVKKDK